MKNNTPTRLATAFAAFTLLASTAAYAQTTYTWDTTIAADGIIDDGDGTWTTGAGNWNDGATSVGINWADGDKALFSGTTGGTITLGSAVTALAQQGGVTFQGGGGTYILETGDNVLTTGGVDVLAGSGPVTIQSTGAGSIALNATKTWSITNGPLTVSAPITGAFGINKFGAGNMTLSNDNNSFTGALNLNNGGNTYLATIKNSGVNSAAGAGDTIQIGNNADLFYTGSGDSTDRTLKVFNSNSTIYNNGTGALVFAGAFANTNNKTGTKTLTLRGSNTDANEIQGAIIDSTTNSNPLNLTKLDPSTWQLSGANTYTGKTLISAGKLVANAADVAATSGALGNGGVIDFNGGTLQYSALSAGTDYGSRFGDSASPIKLNTDGQDVTLASVIDATNTGGLNKNGTGSLTLSGDNLYTGTTSINNGVLVADAVDVLDGGDPLITLSGALGAGGDITFGGGTLQYTATTASTDYSSRITGSGSAMTFDTNGEDVVLASALLGNTGLTKLGAGQLTAQWDLSYNGITKVDGGTLVLVSSSESNKNSNSTGFQINNGSTLKIEKGVAGLRIDGETFTFDSAGGGTLEVNGSQGLWRENTVVTTGGAQNTLGGTAYLNMQNTRTAFYDVADGSDDVGLLVSVEHERGFIVKRGTGTLALTHIHNDLLDTNTITIEDGVFEVAATGRIKRGNWAGAMTNDGIYRHSSTANQTLSGVISGTGAIEMSGTGTFTLNGANTYSGGTTVSGGVLGGTGSIAGLVTVQSGAAIGAGASAGTLTVADLTLEDGSDVIVEIDAWNAGAVIAGTDSDLVAVTGTLTGHTTPGGTTIEIPATPGDFAEAAASFDIITFATPVDVTAGIFAIDDSAWTGTGTWAVSVDVDSVILTYTAGVAADDYDSWATDNGIDGELPGDDFELDGLSNLLEYALGKNPTVADGPAETSFDGTTVVYTKGADAIANGDVRWAIEESDDLGLIDPWAEVVIQEAGDVTATISHTLPSVDAVFVRLKVTQE